LDDERGDFAGTNIGTGPFVHVLVIDPAVARRSEAEAFDHHLQAAGYRVAFASSHEEGVSRLNDGTHHFDLVLLGIEPSADIDVEVCRRVRRSTQVPLLVIGTPDADAFIHDVFEAGAEDYVARPVRWTELLARMRLALKRQCNDDGLTGLCKRTDFDAALRYEWRSAIQARNATPLAVILADVDQLDVYNMRQGYDHGDRSLQDIARVLADAVRRDSDLVAHHDDDAFAVLVPDASAEAAFAIAERVRTIIADRHPRSVTVSFGVAADVPRSGVDALSVVASAKDALQRAKRAGGNRAYSAGDPPSGRRPASTQSVRAVRG
jgi:diguanylate cyclase (GGDEF)-like protein